MQVAKITTSRKSMCLESLMLDHAAACSCGYVRTPAQRVVRREHTCVFLCVCVCVKNAGNYARAAGSSSLRVCVKAEQQLPAHSIHVLASRPHTQTSRARCVSAPSAPQLRPSCPQAALKGGRRSCDPTKPFATKNTNRLRQRATTTLHVASLRFDRPTYDTVMPRRYPPRIAPSSLTFREKCGTSAIPSPPSFLVVGVL